MIKVVIVDDSQTARLVLRKTLETDPEILVVGEAATGREAMQLIGRYNPDIVAIDVYLKEENGLDLAELIMADSPRPIVAITGINPSDPQLIYRALEKGVLEVFPKLPFESHRDYPSQRDTLLKMLKLLAKIPVVHRARGARKLRQKSEAMAPPKRPPLAKPVETGVLKEAFSRVLLIGGSTGGPPIIGKLLTDLPTRFALPIVIAQHISEGFGAGFAAWLSQLSGKTTVLVDRHLALEAGKVYVAPDNRHARFLSVNYIAPTEVTAGEIVWPSIDVLFRSAAQHFGNSVLAVLLTGMGKDGAQGLKELADAGAYTFAQTPETCAVDSMPRTAIELNAARAVLDPEEIARAITRKVRQN